MVRETYEPKTAEEALAAATKYRTLANKFKALYERFDQLATVYTTKAEAMKNQTAPAASPQPDSSIANTPGENTMLK